MAFFMSRLIGVSLGLQNRRVSDSTSLRGAFFHLQTNFNMVQTLTAKMKAVASENPFYGKANLLDFYQKAQSGQISDSLLTQTWNEAKTNRVLKEMFWIIAFSVGDIANRQHNAFKGSKVDQGGSANRVAFQKVLAWTRKNHPSQYERFVTGDVVRQFTTLDNILGLRVKTKPGTKQVVETVNFLEGVDMDALGDYLAGLIHKGNPADNVLIAKFLTNVRTGKRQKTDRKTREKVSGGRELTDQVKRNMKLRTALYLTLSEKMGWKYERKNGYVDFQGLKAWKQEWNQELESVLFSTQKILTLDRVQFAELLEKMPSGARYRVRRRLLGKDNVLKTKWINVHGQNLGTWFLEWEKSKEKAQQESRELTEKVRQGVATEEDVQRLAKVKKEAKVNTGGSTLFDQLDNLVKKSGNRREMDILIHSILEKIRFEVPALVIADCSGSMGGFPKEFARILVTITMLKNPSDELDNLLVTFGSDCNIFTDGSTGTRQKNKFVQGIAQKVDKLIDRTKSFSENHATISNFVHSNDGATNFASVSQRLKQWIESDPDTRTHKIEQLQGYPVFIVVSDGDMNSSYSAAQSMMEFRRTMLQYGWDGVVVVWDVATGQPDPKKFADVPNTMHFFGWNPAIINQVFTKLHDLDIIDVYTPLQKLHQSNRYELVKMNVI